jgi:hypothetical protein
MRIVCLGEEVLNCDSAVKVFLMIDVYYSFLIIVVLLVNNCTSISRIN